MLPAHSGYAKARRRLLENGMELDELRPDSDAFRPGWSLLSGRSPAALHTKAMVFDREAVFIGSFNLDPRSAVINAEAGLYIESPELAGRLTDYMATGVAPANSDRLFAIRRNASVDHFSAYATLSPRRTRPNLAGPICSARFHLLAKVDL
jgi:putative cardiolipin synthase